MKKIITILLSATFLLSATSCGSNAELEALRKENEELKQKSEDHQTNYSESLHAPSSTENKKQATTSELKKISIGETVTVQTEFGDFEIQIDNVHKTGIYKEEQGIFAATIQCVVNNISYSSKLHPDTIHGYDVAKNHNFIQLTDNNGIAFPFYDVSGPTDGAYAISHQLPIGSKARESYPFLVSENINEVSVIINNQYVLNTTIN